MACYQTARNQRAWLAGEATAKRAFALNGEIDKKPVFPEGTLVLEARSIGTDMTVTHEIDAVSSFKLRLLRKPWPRPGQLIGYEWENTRFVGNVREVVMTAEHAQGRRWECIVRGFVREFDGKALID